MILKVLTFGTIGLLLGLRLARTPFGARLVGIPQRVLGIVYLVALLLAGVLAAVFEQWVLLAVVVILLVLSGIEELRRRSAVKAGSAAPSRR